MDENNNSDKKKPERTVDPNLKELKEAYDPNTLINAQVNYDGDSLINAQSEKRN